jgi:RNA 2',3'-cyclic 3'-phosphodiesterase
MDTSARRLFIALPVDEVQAVQSLAEVFKNLKKYESLLKIIPADNFHITVKFFGAIDPVAADSLSNAFLSLNNLKKVEFRIEGIGAFPSTADPSVIWAGLEYDKKPLGEIFQAVEALAASFGYPPEKRKFIPHLTLARVRKEKKVPAELIKFLNTGKDSTFASSVFRELILFESTLHRTGAEYKKIGVIKLI